MNHKLVTIPILFLFVFGLFSAPAAPRVSAGALVVNSLADTSDGLCDLANCTLREAVEAANLAPGADEITFTVTGTISLSSTLPKISDAAGLTIRGPAGGLIISGSSAYRILEVETGAALTLEMLTLANASVDGSGGGVLNWGALAVDRCTFKYNHASSGGAIYDSGGVEPSLVITASTFQGNNAVYGGAVYHGTGTAMITNSSFSGNSALEGAAVANGSGWGVYIINSTFAGNSATGEGGGILHNYSGGIRLKNTIVANPVLGVNCFRIYNEGNNIDSGSSCAFGSAMGSLSNTDPLLWSLADNGGPTWTFALLSGSPAIDGVTYNPPNDAPAADQRGISRPQGARFDIGAMEVEQEYYRTSLPLVVR